MRTFNHTWCGRRITAERALGILVRRFGCLWSAFERRERDALLMVMCCVKLHNICIYNWKQNNPGTSPSEIRIPSHDSVPEDINEVDDGDEIIERLENKYKVGLRRAKQNRFRLTLCERLYSLGIQIENDDDFVD